MTPNEDAALRRTLRELRTELRETQTKFAERLHVTLATTHRWETVRAPSGTALLGCARIAHEAGRLDLEHKFLLAVLEAIEEGFDVTPDVWQRLADVAAERRLADIAGPRHSFLSTRDADTSADVEKPAKYRK